MTITEKETTHIEWVSVHTSLPESGIEVIAMLDMQGQVFITNVIFNPESGWSNTTKDHPVNFNSVKFWSHYNLPK